MNWNEYLAKLEVPGTWDDIMRDWNKLYGPGHPWHYALASNLSRDFGRGQQAVTGTKYALSGVPGQPMTVTELEAGIDNLKRRLETHIEKSGHRRFEEES
jgi:hypothetical protein